MKKYIFTCANCGASWEVYADGVSREELEREKQCKCGAVATVTKEGKK
jgi:hypothetical protein